MKFVGAVLLNNDHAWRGCLDLYVQRGRVIARKWQMIAPLKRQAMLRQREKEAKKEIGESTI
jgi:hypothetical protein